MFTPYAEPTERDLKKWNRKGSISYIGLFVDDLETRRGIIRFCRVNNIPIHENIICHHVTLKFKPSKDVVEKIEHLLGKEFEVKITGYGSSSDVTALRVSLDGIQSDNTVPHVTISLGPKGEAKMSNDLHYKDIDNGPVFTTTLGIHGRGRSMDYIPWK